LAGFQGPQRRERGRKGLGGKGIRREKGEEAAGRGRKKCNVAQ